MPWANLGGAPVVVEMDRIFLLACPNVELQTQDDDVDEVFSGPCLVLTLLSHRVQHSA